MAMNQYMPGTGNPAQTMQQQQPLIQALRQPQPMQQPSGPQLIPAQSGMGGPQLMPAQSGMGGPQLMPAQSGMDPRVTNMIGTGLAKGGQYLYDNLRTANQYGTSPFSEQTRGLQAADAGLR